MTEFEIHQLAIVSRSEFDSATVVYMAWAVAFMFLCRDLTARWSARLAVAVGAVYLSGCLLLLLRCSASMVRYGRQLALLHAFPSFSILLNPGGLWRITLSVRYGFLALATLVPLYFIWLKATARDAAISTSAK